MKVSKKIVLMFLAFVMAIALAVPSLGFVTEVLALTGKTEGIICEGVSVSGIDLTGKTAEEAKELLREQFAYLMSKKVLVEIASEGEIKTTEEVALSELGFETAGDEVVAEAVEEALAIGTKGNLIERYKELKDTAENKVEHKLDFKYDETKLDAFIKSLGKKYEIKPEDATLTRENGKFVVTGGKTGYRFEKKSMAKSIKEMVDGFVAGLPATLNTETKFTAELKTEKPKYEKEELAKIQDLLGTYTTSYGAGATGRILNIINGAKQINGSLLLPGELLSANKKMYPYTIANGYHMGGAFLNGKVVNDIGGGICQVSSTLYNAALYSEIGIEKRQSHSMTVSYVPLARDAAIAGDYKDLVIKNDRKEPIYIEAITGGGKITFNIYGKETRDLAHRKVDFVTVTRQTIAPGKPIITEDPEQPEDYEKEVQGAWTGFKTELYKVVKVNGVETERTLVNSSNYKANPAYVVKGTKKIKDSEKKKKKKKTEELTEATEEEDAVDDYEDEFIEEVDEGEEE